MNLAPAARVPMNLAPAARSIHGGPDGFTHVVWSFFWTLWDARNRSGLQLHFAKL